MAIAIAEVFVRVRKTPESADIAKRLRAVWAETGLTAREVAERMGLTSPESFRQYLKGNIVNWPAAVPKLAVGLGREPDALAEQLGVAFDPDAAALMARIKAMSPERRQRVGAIYDQLVELPPHLQDKWFEMADHAMVWIRHEDRKI